MTARVFIVHGWEGYPQEGWFPWLKKELEKKKCAVRVLRMPNTETPKIDEWVPFLAKNIGVPDKNTFLVGHSIGGQTILRYLETLPKGKEIGGAVFVAGWVTLEPTHLQEEGPAVVEIAHPWLATPLHWDKIRMHCPEFIAIFSDSDPYVSPENADVFKDKLGAKIILEHNKGHFSGSDRVKQLPSALNALTHLIEHH